jgi:hypothetical protein
MDAGRPGAQGSDGCVAVKGEDVMANVSRGASRGHSPGGSDQPGSFSVIDAWIDQIRAVGKTRHGLSPDALADLIEDRRCVPRMVVVECNAHQAIHLARQLEDELDVEAVPWCLRDQGEPPMLPLVGTYFHYAEIRERWQDRTSSMRFVTIRTDPILKERARPIVERHQIVGATLVERDIGTAQEAAVEMTAVLGFQVKPAVDDPADVLARLPNTELILISPALWDLTPAEVKTHERVLDPQASVIREDIQQLRHSIWSWRRMC